MSFKEYLHVENLNNVEAKGILKGTCHIFPKLDGTNGSVWSDDNVIRAGSRKRELSIEHDNAGFYKGVRQNSTIKQFFAATGANYRLFGEWLVPHNLKTYYDNAWRIFYIFDVYDRLRQKYVSYTEYQPILERFYLWYVPCIDAINKPSKDRLQRYVDNNKYLIRPGRGLGEGVVIKNYDFINKYGRFTYAKIVRDECKQRQSKTKQKNRLQKGQLEEIIVDKYITNVICNKAYAKIANSTDGWSDKHIPRLLNTIFHDLVVEEIWNILKQFKNPTINFKYLQKLCNEKIKELKSELF